MIKYLLLLVFITSCPFITHGQGILTWYSIQSFVNYYDDLEIMVPYSMRFTRLLPDAVLNRSTTDFTNFTYVILESLTFTKANGNFSYTADPSTNTVVSSGGTLSASISFNWADKEPWEIYATNGIGKASISSTYVLFNKTLAYDDVPYTTVNMSVNWGTWNLTTDYDDPVVRKRLNQAINIAVTSIFGNQIVNTIVGILNQRYSVVSKNWATSAIYQYMKNSLYFDNSINIFDMTEDYLITSKNGSLIGFLTSTQTENPFDIVDNMDYQIAVTQECLQNFIRYTCLNNYFHWNLHSSNYPIDGFDYTIQALANVYPSILKQYNGSVPIFFMCYANYSNLPNATLNFYAGAIEVVLQILCNTITDDQNQDMVFSFNFLANFITDLKLTPLGETQASFVGVNLIGNVVAKQNITSFNQLILNYYVLTGLESLLDTYTTWGTYFYFSIVQPRVNITADYIFIYGEYVHPVVPSTPIENQLNQMNNDEKNVGFLRVSE